MALKRAIRRRGCEGKKIYTDAAQAEFDAGVLSRLKGFPFNTYRCHLGHLHVGHMPKRVQQAMAARRADR